MQASLNFRAILGTSTGAYVRKYVSERYVLHVNIINIALYYSFHIMGQQIPTIQFLRMGFIH